MQNGNDPQHKNLDNLLQKYHMNHILILFVHLKQTKLNNGVYSDV